MSIKSDFKILTKLVKGARGNSLEQRLDSFYADQADDYDDFRRRLLPGRQQLIADTPFPKEAVWLDLGAGTGINLEYCEAPEQMKKIYLVDLCAPLLSVAQKRASHLGLRNVQIVHHDVDTYQPEQPVDVITISYALTMMPNWMGVLDRVRQWLKPGGVLSVVDFYISRKHEGPKRSRHPWLTRVFWPVWFSWDNVFLNEGHLPTLEYFFKPIRIQENRAPVPYLPLGRVPYYQFIGTNPI